MAIEFHRAASYLLLPNVMKLVLERKRLLGTLRLPHRHLQIVTVRMKQSTKNYSKRSNRVNKMSKLFIFVYTCDLLVPLFWHSDGHPLLNFLLTTDSHALVLEKQCRDQPESRVHDEATINELQRDRVPLNHKWQLICCHEGHVNAGGARDVS